MPFSLWTIPLDQPDAVVRTLAAALDEDEQRHAAARAFAEARTRYVVAHGAVRHVLGATLDTAPERVQIQRRCRHCGHPNHGKPFVTDGPSFSLSHSGDVAVLAVSEAGAIGVDIEVRRSRSHLDRLAHRIFSDTELERWVATAPVDRLDAFLDAWTAKEAYLKALGLGLVGSLRDVPVHPEGWTMLPFRPVPAAVATVALEGTARGVPRVATWSPANGVTLPRAW